MQILKIEVFGRDSRLSSILTFHVGRLIVELEQYVFLYFKITWLDEQYNLFLELNKFKYYFTVNDVKIRC